MSESDSELQEMKEQQPRLVILTKPISAAILWFLHRMQGGEPLFEQGTRSTDNEKREIIRLYFHAAFSNRMKLYFPLLVTVLGLAAYDSCRVGILPLQGYGLILDGLGAIIIAIGLFRGVDGILRDSPRKSYASKFSVSYVYFSPKPLTSTVNNTIDGLFGSSFLFIGFSVQLYAISNLTLSLC